MTAAFRGLEISLQLLEYRHRTFVQSWASLHGETGVWLS